MKKKQKRKKKQPNDGGLKLEHMQAHYPQTKDIQMEYHSLNEEERQYISDWILKRRVNWLKGISIFEAVLIFLQFIICMVDRDEPNTVFIFGEAIVIAVIFYGLSIFVRKKNERDLASIDFDNVQEVIFLSCHSTRGRASTENKGAYRIWVYQWDDEKQKFYHTRLNSDVPIRREMGDIVYHPKGTELCLPKLEEKL